MRATWVGSSTQASVNRIVARWITEDRITGGMGLGGGNRLGAMFGWGEGARSMQRLPRKPQVGPRKDFPPSSPRSKASSLEIAPRPLLLVAPKSTVSSAINLPIQDSIDSGGSVVNTPVPQFGWSSSGERAKWPALDTPRSAISAHQRAVSMISMPYSISPVSSLGPLGAMSYPSPRSRPASLDLSGRKTSESLQTRGSKSAASRTSIPSPRMISPARAAIQLASPASQGNSSIRDSNQRVAKVKPDASEEHCNPWASTDLSICDSRSSTEISQFQPLCPRGFTRLDVRKPNKDATEDEIVEADRAIKGLPNLSYMLL